MGNRWKTMDKLHQRWCVTCRWFDEIVTFLGVLIFFYTESMGCVCGY